MLITRLGRTLNVIVFRTDDKVPRNSNSSGRDAEYFLMKRRGAPNATKQLFLISSVLVVFKGLMVASKASVKWTGESMGVLIHPNWVAVFNALEVIITSALAVLTFKCV